MTNNPDNVYNKNIWFNQRKRSCEDMSRSGLWLAGEFMRDSRALDTQVFTHVLVLFLRAI